MPRERHSCCACAHFRKKCEPNCPTAPYFPPGRQDDFENVHRLFGVKRFLNHIDGIQSPHLKEIAAENLILHARARANFPVGGCQEIVSYLNQQIRLLEEELYLTKSYLLAHQAGTGNVNNNATVAERGSGSCGFLRQQEEQEHKDFQDTVNILPSNYPPLSKEIKDRNQESASSSSCCLVSNYKRTDPLGGPPPSLPFIDVTRQKPSAPPPPLPVPRAFMDLNKESNPLTSELNEGDIRTSFHGPKDVIPGSDNVLLNEDIGPMQYQYQHQHQQEHPSNDDALQFSLGEQQKKKDKML